MLHLVELVLHLKGLKPLVSWFLRIEGVGASSGLVPTKL